MRLQRRMVSLLVAASFSAMSWSPNVFAARAMDDFVIHGIDFQGLQSIQRNTVITYLPVHSGDRYTDVVGNRILRNLYQSGFFNSVRLSREGDTLVIYVDERPTIAAIDISGNKKMATTSLTDILKSHGLSEGRIFNNQVLEQIQHSLLHEYNSVGRYNATVDVVVKNLPRNRVSISLKISEGAVARIKTIRFTGNDMIPEHVLRNNLRMEPHNLINWFTGEDQYTPAKLQDGLRAITDYYMFHGYLHFKINSVQTALSEDQKDIYITINVNEGARYRFSGFDIRGKYVLPQEVLSKQILVKSGDLFSKEVIDNSIKKVSIALGNKGYGMPAVSIEPQVDEETKQVFVHFVIDAGNRVYVRRINFDGNIKTADYVLRRAMMQRESAILITDYVDESKRRLRSLGYLKNIDYKLVPVMGANNQVDLNYHVDEDHSAEAMAAVSYSREYLWHLNASYNQHNFRGTGNTLGFNVSTTAQGQNYAVSYYNPFYTTTGIGRGVSGFYQHHTTNNTDIANYDMNKVGGVLSYNIPITDYMAAQAGFGYQNQLLKIGTIPAPQYTAFANNNGTRFNEFLTTAGLSFGNYDGFPFPIQGVSSSLSGMVSAGDLNYYKLSSVTEAYYPIYFGFIGGLRGLIAYGNALDSGHFQWPFFENNYGGGLTDFVRVRGYEAHSLGPRDGTIYKRPIGGNVGLSGTAELILPYPLSGNTYRISTFVDAGNVYQNSLPLTYQGTNAGPVRFSYGVQLQWRSPFGPLVFSLAKPINLQENDTVETFQFSISGGM